MKVMKYGMGKWLVLPLLGAVAIFAATASCMIETSGGQSPRPTTTPTIAPTASPGPVADTIIVDHSAVALFSAIPDQYMSAIKSMWISIPGESHSSGYRNGLNLLEDQDADFDVNVLEDGTPEMPTNAHLRASRASWGDYGHPTGWRYEYGEKDWFTNATAISQTKAFLKYADDNGFGLSAVGFGWCWDMTWLNDPTSTKDSVYECGWAGSSMEGPQGNLPWGLDDADTAITGNSVCLDTYLDATQQYIDYCAANGIQTKVFFTTGPVDGEEGTENGYQRQLKHERIRAYVNAHGGILFDYADILAWNNAGVETRTTWSGHSMQNIAADNMLDLDGSYAEDGDHIGERGTVRLGKAIWYMLARLAGWDGN